MTDHYPAGSRSPTPPPGTTQPPLPQPPIPPPSAPWISPQGLAVAREVTGLVFIVGGGLCVLGCLLVLGGVTLMLLGISGLVMAGGFALTTRRPDV